MRKINHNFRSCLIGFFSQAVVVHHEYNKCWLRKQDSITSPPTIFQRSCQGSVEHRFSSSLSLGAVNVILKAIYVLTNTSNSTEEAGEAGVKEGTWKTREIRDTRQKGQVFEHSRSHRCDCLILFSS